MTACSRCCATPTGPTRTSRTAAKALEEAGHPVFELAVHGAADLGRIFFLAEFAVAVAGWALEINPFDQPNVQEAKDNTKRVLESGKVPALSDFDADDDALRALLGDANPPHYVAIMGYVPFSDEFDRAVAELRRRHPRRHPCGDDLRLRAAVPALDRAAAQGRRPGRPVPAAHLRAAPRRRGAGRGLLVRQADRRAGGRRPADAARPRAARRAGQPG